MTSIKRTPSSATKPKKRISAATRTKGLLKAPSRKKAATWNNHRLASSKSKKSLTAGSKETTKTRKAFDKKSFSSTIRRNPVKPPSKEKAAALNKQAGGKPYERPSRTKTGAKPATKPGSKETTKTKKATEKKVFSSTIRRNTVKPPKGDYSKIRNVTPADKEKARKKRMSELEKAKPRKHPSKTKKPPLPPSKGKRKPAVPTAPGGKPKSSGAKKRPDFSSLKSKYKKTKYSGARKAAPARATAGPSKPPSRKQQVKDRKVARQSSTNMKRGAARLKSKFSRMFSKKK